jgi:large subunit ribosomal protein L25
MAEIILNVDVRSGVGTGGARAARRAGMVPGVLYGGDKAPVAISVNERDFRKSLYTGKLLSGVTFDENLDKSKPFVFRVGRDQVIQGWDQILQLMRVGEKRIVIIPPELAYGTRGQQPKIGRNATLVFVVELLEIKPD